MRQSIQQVEARGLTHLPALPILNAVDAGRDIIFYDGTCGLCHRFVRFVLARDRGARFRFAPIEGRTFQAIASAEVRQRLPDSIAAATAGGSLLTRSAAVFYILERLPRWRHAAALGKLLPQGMADRVYDAVARNRRRFFARPARACPVLPPALRSRMLDIEQP